MPLIADGPAPYAPPTAVTGLITGYRDRGFATPFTTDVLVRAGVPDSLANRTMQSMKLLDLIDESGHPTPVLESIKRARGQDEFTAELKEWLYNVYADVLQYADPTRDDTGRVSEAFRGYKPEGQRQRMVTLMLGLFEFAGLVEQRRDAAPTPRKAAAPRRQATPRQARPERTSAPPLDPSLQSGPTASAGLPPELLGLLQSIPSDRRWTKDRRDAFVTAFTTVLDYAITIVPAGWADAGEGDEP